MSLGSICVRTNLDCLHKFEELADRSIDIPYGHSVELLVSYIRKLENSVR